MKYKHFSEAELTCQCGCGQQLMNPSFMFLVEELRERVGFALPVSSAYRCPEHNNNVSKSGYDGPHTTGRAIDLRVSHEKSYQVLRIAMSMGFTGIGVNQKGDGRFIHLDDLSGAPNRPRPHVWSY